MVPVNFSKGEHVNFNGSDAVVYSNNNASLTVTIILDNGEKVTVPRNMLSIWNQDKQEQNEGLQARIDALNEEIEEGSQKIKESNKKWTIANAAYHASNTGIHSLFSRLGILSEDEHLIYNSEDLAEYNELCHNKSAAMAARNRASSDVIHYANQTTTSIFTRHKYELQQMLFENYA